MKQLSKYQTVFIELLRAGLWGIGNPDVRIDGTTDWQEVYQLATEQSVLGLVLAGLESSGVKPPKELLLQMIGEVQVIEQRNKAMNLFVAEAVEKMREAGIYTLLVKGQGIAQCYERPLWRACGDVDLFLSEDNYEKARKMLTAQASSVEEEDPYTRHIGMKIGSWELELHGNLRGGFSGRADKMLDEIKEDTFYGGKVRSWMNGGTQVFMLSAENDVVYVFTHILHHFFRGGIGLRQVCDWCRLLFCFRDKLDLRLLESRIRKAGLMSEWKAFGSFAVEYQGMPVEAMPFYSTDIRWRKKGKRILSRILQTGNFGHNIDEGFRQDKSFVVRKIGAIRCYLSEAYSNFMVFPFDSIRALCITMKSGLLSTLGLK